MVLNYILVGCPCWRGTKSLLTDKLQPDENLNFYELMIRFIPFSFSLSLDHFRFRNSKQRKSLLGQGGLEINKPKKNRPLALRGHVTNASFKQWVGILPMPKIDRTHKNYLAPEIWEETHLRQIFFGTLIFQQSSMIEFSTIHKCCLNIAVSCQHKIQFKTAWPLGSAPSWGGKREETLEPSGCGRS